MFRRFRGTGLPVLLIKPDRVVRIPLDQAMDRVLGGVPSRAIEPELGVVEFWTDGGRMINRHATELLSAVLAAAAAGVLDVGEDRRTRLCCLRAHGWDPAITGTCLMTGPLVDGAATALPRSFLTWLRRQHPHRVHAATALRRRGARWT
ncbi:hypothetical protein [Actinokineospora sp. UTMC 2448]|uniref:hypothetical protein n=1 Tax=Actinokineospora sp. UTMC 2448 TaxID=2268449 RepID=UPI00216418C5|nr:hypothetical protein [Actinokineospora sp. UTMC 2448]UVS80592.1 hypothetical protein Actkin_04343 [Actinokineospora sp. UTMC 2448]